MRYVLNSLSIFLVALLALTLGCRRDDQPAPQKQGRISATATYEKYFGPAPTPLEGTCFAMAGFLPLAENPQKVVPLPLFMFSEENRMHAMVNRLLTMDEDAGRRIGVISPLPKGTVLMALHQHENTVSLDLHPPPGLKPSTAKPVFAALGHSLVQFPGVEKIVITLDGLPLEGLPEQGYVPSQADVADPGEPLILGVVGEWGEPDQGLKELSVFFDRPVHVDEILVTPQGGVPVQGEYFQSIFDMAIVVHPQDPMAFLEGMQMQVKYRATDPLGRSAGGTENFPLMRMVRP